MIKKYEILPHPSEVRFRIFGESIEDIFINSLEAINSILSDKIGTEKIRKEKINIKSLDLNSLLIDFLNEALALSQIKKSICRIAKIKVNTFSFELSALCYFSPIEKFNEDIKAITYEDLNIQKIKNKKKEIWQTDLVIDI